MGAWLAPWPPASQPKGGPGPKVLKGLLLGGSWVVISRVMGFL